MLSKQHRWATTRRACHCEFVELCYKPVDMLRAGVVEPLRVKTQAIMSAAEAAVMILRIDDVIASSRAQGPAGGMPPGGMPPGMGDY